MQRKGQNPSALLLRAAAASHEVVMFTSHLLQEGGSACPFGMF